jgi:hypothetical protein
MEHPRILGMEEVSESRVRHKPPSEVSLRARKTAVNVPRRDIYVTSVSHR